MLTTTPANPQTVAEPFPDLIDESFDEAAFLWRRWESELTSLTRSALPEEKAGATPTPTPAKSRVGAGPRAAEENEKIVDSTSVNLVFTGSPAAARKVFNQVASAKEQFYVIRTLQVKNQADKGPKRGEAPAPTAPSPPEVAGAKGKTSEPGITFIVGNEHLNVAAKIEIVRFNVPEKETR